MFLLKSTEHNVLPFLLVSSIFFFFFWFKLSDAAAHGPTKISPGITDGEEYGVVSLGMRRLFDKKEKNEIGSNSSLILAENRTHRRDPLDGFKYYHGGWNIRNKHYFSSVGFTAAPLFVVAILWFLGFSLYLLVSCLRRCCCKNWNYGCPQTVCAFSLVLLIFFTIAAIIGCIVLYTGQAKLYRSTNSTLGYVVDEADITVETLRNFSDSLASAKGIGVGQFSLPSNVQGNIDRVIKEINSAAGTLKTETDKNYDRIRDALDLVRVALIVITAILLLLALVGFLFSFLGLRFLVHMLMIVGWVLVTVTFILCGIFLVLHNVIGDSCVAMNEWVQHPTAHTALDDIIPCVDNATAQDALSQSKDVTVQLVGIVNTFITKISNAKVPPGAGPAYYNQSGPLVPILCNPFNFDKTDHHCTTAEVTFDNAANEWRKYICQVSSNGTCTTVGRLTPTYYNQMVAVVNVSNGIYRYGPFLVDLGDCTFLWEIFTDIHNDHCPGLRRYSKVINVGLLMASIASMLSLTLWLSHASERQHRERRKESIPTSSQPFPRVTE